ncbi:MAG: cupin [Mesorhizobium amorphae]|nr:MAG: cupin [Mesorhizobium amorphae]
MFATAQQGSQAERDPRSAGPWDQDVTLIHPATTDLARQGMPQFFGISEHSAGSRGISMNMTAFPPGVAARAHFHRDFETAIYGVSGRIILLYGKELEQEMLIEPGSFCFIPAWIPHKPFNLSTTEPATALSARNDAHEQENVVLTPELEGEAIEKLIAERRATHVG